MRILVFDTETTGIIPRSENGEKIAKELYPHIVQLSFIIYETQTKELVKSYDYVIDTAKHFPIPEETIKVHGITNEKSINEGIPIKKALQAFINELYCCDYLVAHNINFDLSMLKIELERMNIDPTKILKNEKLKRVEHYCTMQKGRYLCKIPIVSEKTGKTYYKSPKQYELHKHLFGTTPVNLHNSLNDVLVCLRCFIMLQFKRDVCDYSEELKLMLKSKVNI